MPEQDDRAAEPQETGHDELALDFDGLDGSARRALVCMPRGRLPLHSALLVPGIALPGRVPIKGYVATIAAELARLGVAVMRCEPRWSQPGGPALEELDWHSEIDDYEATLRLLQRQSWADPSQLYIVGMSLGGVLAPFIAGRAGGVAGIFSWGATARPWPRYAAANVRNQLVWRGSPADTIARAVELSQWYHRSLAETSLSGEQLLAAKPGLAELEVTPAGYLGRPTIFWRQLCQFDPAEAYRGLSCRICTARGAADFASHPADQQAIVTAAEQAGLSVQAVTLSGLEHLLRQADSPKQACCSGCGRGDPDYARLTRLIVAWMDDEPLEAHAE